MLSQARLRYIVLCCHTSIHIYLRPKGRETKASPGVRHGDSYKDVQRYNYRYRCIYIYNPYPFTGGTSPNCNYILGR